MIRLMIVDDYELIRHTLCEFFDGFCNDMIEVVAVAGNGGEALERIERERPDVVLMDVSMPDMDGFTATELIKGRFSDIHIITYSGFEDISFVSKARSVGACRHVQKPFDFFDLKDLIVEVAT